MATKKRPMARARLRPKVREDLDQLRCDACGLNHPIYLQPKCHDAPTVAMYDRRDGTLTILCLTCEREVERVQVARRELVQ